MDVEHNACMLGRAGWPARLRGALVHTHTENKDLTSKLRPNSEPTLFFFFFTWPGGLGREDVGR